MSVISFELFNILIKKRRSLFHFTKKETGSERQSIMAGMTPTMCARVGIGAQVCLSLGPCLSHFVPVVFPVCALSWITRLA